MKIATSFAIAATLLSIIACTGPIVLKETRIFERDPRAERFFEQLDKVVAKYRVTDASAFKVRGFPYLRTNRFLAAMKERLPSRDAAFFWTEQMVSVDRRSRIKELATLPIEAFQEINDATGDRLDRESAVQKVEQYARMLLSNDASHPDFVRTLKQAATVPDEYSTLSRFLGLYPLAGIPVTIATAVAYQRYRKWHQTPLDELEIDGMIVRFYPREPDTPADSIGIRRLYDPPNLDAFGLPVLTRETERQLADLFAPAIHQDVVSGYDRIGRVTWEKNRVTVDPRYPTAYFYTSRSFLDGRPVLQLNFVFWYAERSGDNAPWIERGPLDGLTYRVTLNHEGQLAIADIMNTCGCYYFMVPRKALVDKIVVTPGEIAPLVPTWLPADDPQKRIALRVNSGWHQVQKVMVNADAGRMIPYDLVPYTELEMLQKNEGQKESVFTRDGIMKDSYRIEPYIFFSMGIPNIGFMRQRGHHAIKMVGRDHFTDPELFDKTFQYPPLVRQP